MNISTSKENADYEWAVQLNRYFLDPIGLWPVDYYGKRKYFMTLLIAAFFTLTLFICTIPLFCSLIMSCDDLILFTDNLAYFVPVMMSHLKYVIIYKNKKVLSTVLNTMAEDWAKSKTDGEEAVMRRRARIGRVISVLCFTLIVFLMVLMFILPRFGITIRYVRNGTDIRKTFPMPSYYLTDVYRSPYFEMILIVHVIYLWPVIICYTGIDNFLGILVFHVCGQLENLRARLANMKGSKSFDRVLATSVEDHIRVIRTVDTIENTFSFLLLTELLYYLLFLCIYGLLLISMLEDKSHVSTLRMFFLLSVFVCTSLQMLFYCIAGQILETESEGVYHAVYECDWLNLQSKSAKSLILIMARANTPLYITAGKLFPMTMLTFCNTLKVSLSYISFLITKL